MKWKYKKFILATCFAIFFPVSADAAEIENFNFDASNIIISADGACDGARLPTYIVSAATTTQIIYSAEANCSEGKYRFSDDLKQWKIGKGRYLFKVKTPNADSTNLDIKYQREFEVSSDIMPAQNAGAGFFGLPPASATSTYSFFGLAVNGQETLMANAAFLAKLSIYGGDANESQLLIEAVANQTKNLTEWRNGRNELTAWIAPNGNFGASGTMYLDNEIKIKKNTVDNPIADAWATYSTSDTKDILRIIDNPSGFLDKIIGSKTVEYKKKVVVDDEYSAALTGKVDSEWLKESELKNQAIENLKEEIDRLAAAGEDTAGLESQLAGDETAFQEFLASEAEWRSVKKTELDSGSWSAQKKAELIAWKGGLPKYTHSIYGLLADDPSTPKGFLTYDEDDNIIGFDLGGYAGFLNLALKEAAIRLKNLENSVIINNDGQVFTSSTSYASGGTLFREALFINNTGASNTVNIQTASSTVFNIDVAGNSLFGPSVDSADALRVRNADNTEILFTVDTENNMVKIGDNDEAGNPTTIFVLDSKADAGDPAGTDGAMYYNSSVGKFRCFEGGDWKDCAGGGTVGGSGFRESYFTFFSEAKPVSF